jgi:DNA-binding helix-hairpin-helix protein with protein kinase domain
LTATLASYGIETAADVDASIAGKVLGFGPARTADLLAWRAQVESLFRFDPSKGVDPADRQWDDGVVLQVPLYAYALARKHPGTQALRLE